jgi:predicted metalloprotease with PDZ domain
MTVAAVTEGSGAAIAGLKVGDVLVEINGAIVGEESSESTARLRPGDTITVKVRGRRGSERELKWKVGSRDEVSYRLKDIDNLNAAQRERRAAWLKGEAQILQQTHSR